MQKGVIEAGLRCGACKGLDEEFKKVAKAMAAEFANRFTIRESGFVLDQILIQNRIENLMQEELEHLPGLSPYEFRKKTAIQTIFRGLDGFDFLVTMAGETDSDYFYYAQHFFAALVVSYIHRNSFFTSSMDKAELVNELYFQVHMALKRCAEKRKLEAEQAALEKREAKKIYLSFDILNHMFRAAINEMTGVERLPFTLHRKDTEQYYRFRAEITNPNNHYTRSDSMELAKKLSMPHKAVLSYWDLFFMEENGFLSTSSFEDDENAEKMYGAYIEQGFEKMDVNTIRDLILTDEIDRNVFDRFLANASSTLTGREVNELKTTRYRVKNMLNTLRTELKPIYEEYIGVDGGGW